MNGFPDDFQIHFKVAMCQSITHFIGESPRNLSVHFREAGVVFRNVVARLADNLEIADYGILGFFIAEKGDLGQVFHITINALYGIENVL